MNHKTIALLFFLVALPLTQVASAQLPPPSSPGCPGQYLFNDGTHWAYEKVLCPTNINDPTNCQPTYFNPMRILIFNGNIGDTSPPCQFPNGGTECECKNNAVPVGEGGSGPLAYKPNGKKPAKLNDAADGIPGSHVINVKEYVGKTAAGVWYKFIQGEVDKSGATPISFYLCYKINAADNPVRQADAGGGAYTPDAWFLKNADGTEIGVKEALGSPKKVTTTIDGKPTDYVVIYAPAKKKKASPTPTPDNSKSSTAPTPSKDSSSTSDGATTPTEDTSKDDTNN